MKTMKTAVGEDHIKIVNIQGRNYRKRNIVRPTTATLGHYLPDYNEEEEPEEVSSLKFEKDDEGNLLTKIEIAPAFYKFILGKKGQTKQRIEKDTRTRLVIPKEGSPDDTITIIGPTKTCISNAHDRIDIICETAIKAVPFTHFISIPLNTSNIKSSAIQFSQDLANEAKKTAIEVISPLSIYTTTLVYIID
eukprot:TRINITY_DN3908_c0_g1_i4.p1 TRINITY_DN3908_c0_g1~~TRINITY_DN3908_c0_g1_i4.p1  ORF type:complete len:192 (-),score=41.42 TRINITY_DN3908_c0_g1_i4:37-612(-)